MPLSRDPAKRARQLANLRSAPPAPAGHRRALVHGAYASVARDRIDAKARAVFDAIAADAPVRENGGLPAADGVVVALLAEALCRLDDIGAYLSMHGWADEHGSPRPVLDAERSLRGQVLSLCVELGMTPRSRAALGLDLVRAGQALDLAKHWQENGGGDG
jgi:phage terminase small subunit